MTDHSPPSVHDFARSLVRTSIALFVASPLWLVPGSFLFTGAERLCDALAAQHSTKQVVEVVVATIAFAPLHLNLLTPLLAKRLLGARARRLLPAGSILVVSDDDRTWRLFARATVVTAAFLIVLLLGKSMGPFGSSLAGIVLALVLVPALWFYRLVVITVLWFRHARSLDESVAVLSRAEPGYREPARFFLEPDERRREVVIERVDGARVHLKYLDAARLGAQSDAPTGRIEGVTEVWRAAGPRGAKSLAAWLGGS
jgi:hypothetical protein